MRHLVLTISLLTTTFAGSACAQKAATPAGPAVPDSVLGEWYGESKCVIKDSPCKDEVVIYHVARAKDDQTKVHWSADKVVNGKPEAMGDLDCTYGTSDSTIRCEFKIPRTGGTGIWSFKIDGDKMHGTLTSDDQLYRNVETSRKKPE